MTTTVERQPVIIDGIEIPSTNTDSRGPFYGHSCYLSAVVSLLSRNTNLEPVAVQYRETEIMVDCRGFSNFTHETLAYLSRYFGLERGWAINGWDVSMESPGDYPEDGARMLQVLLWLDKAKALAGSGGTPPDELKAQLSYGCQMVANQRYGRD